MFEKSYFDRLQDYIESGCQNELTAEEQEYYNALYAVVGINRKYGKDRAIAFLMHKPFGCTRPRAREMYNEAVNLFFADDTIENRAHRNMIFENLKRLQVLGKITRVGGRKMGEWKIKRKEMKEKEIKVYTLDSDKIGIPRIDRTELAAQIDSIENLSERDRTRIKADAGVIDVNFEEMLDDTQEKTSAFRK